MDAVIHDIELPPQPPMTYAEMAAMLRGYGYPLNGSYAVDGRRFDPTGDLAFESPKSNNQGRQG